MTAPKIPDQDVVALLAPLRPGARHTIEHLHKLYVRVAEEAGRPAASSMALNRALQRHGCHQEIHRKGRGGRGRQQRTYVTIWEVPGRPNGAPVDDEVTALVRDLGEGLHPLETIYRRYLQMNFPGERLTRPVLMTELGRRGYPEMRDGKKGQPGGGRLCRFLPRLMDVSANS